MKIFANTAIVGTGLIGGSIALAMKKKNLCRKIIGVSLHKKSLISAKKIGAIDTGARSLEIIKGADLVILALPVSAILSLAPKIAKLISKDCLVFDVGSTKAKIVSGLSKLFPLFVGAHPLAGSEKRGINNARADLFFNSLCILTPVKNTDSSAFAKVKKIWNALGAGVLIMSPEKHDRILGFTSHLAHLLAFSLINAIPDEFFKFSSPSFKDATRVAASDSALWKDIIFDNKENVLKAIEEFQKNLEFAKSAIKKNSFAELEGFFQKAKKKKENLK